MIKAIIDKLTVTVAIGASGVNIFFHFEKSAIFNIRKIKVILQPDLHVVKGI